MKSVIIDGRDLLHFGLCLFDKAFASNCSSPVDTATTLPVSRNVLRLSCAHYIQAV